MSAEQLCQTIDQLVAELPTLAGCALVEVATGMVWHSAGHFEGLQALAEATSDYWRLSARLNQQFTPLGAMQACILMHERGRITLRPCTESMIFVTISAHNAAVDWGLWQKRTNQIAAMVKAL